MDLSLDQHIEAAASELATMARKAWRLMERDGLVPTYSERPDISRHRTMVRSAFRDSLYGPSSEARDAWTGHRPWIWRHSWTGRRHRYYPKKKEMAVKAACQLLEEGLLQEMAWEEPVPIDTWQWANVLLHLVQPIRGDDYHGYLNHALSPAMVRFIRDEATAGTDQQKLANAFRVRLSSIENIVSRRTYRHVK